MSIVGEAPTPHARHERSILAAVVVSTLLVVAGPILAAEFGGGIQGVYVERTNLTETAQRVLAEMPGAYEADGMVVVPADQDPFVAWAEPLRSDRVVGEVVDLGVRGITEYGSLPSYGELPRWLGDVTSADRVFSDVGNLSFACTSFPGATDCTGTLLIDRAGDQQIFRAGLGSPETPDPVMHFTGYGAGVEHDIYIGWLPPGASTVWATVVGNQYIRDVPARTSGVGVVAGQTVWWLYSSEPVSAVSFHDDRGEVLERMTMVD